MSTDVLYTAVTRAKTHLYVIGDMVAFNKMIELGKIDRATHAVVSSIRVLGGMVKILCRGGVNKCPEVFKRLISDWILSFSS